ncbi:MAG: XrtB/PEP-CTERM-associated polysaccharide biosynthesis outer membrane protein EpsL [Burkholderiaceae bacterium]|jgi:exopolysaccharide biosynthesis operon protein EpsL
MRGTKGKGFGDIGSRQRLSGGAQDNVAPVPKTMRTRALLSRITARTERPERHAAAERRSQVVRMRELIGPTSLIAAGLITSPAAFAQADAALGQAQDPLTLRVSASEEYDDNLFRLPDGAPATAVPGQTARSDLISVQELGLKFDKDYSLQHITLDLNLVNYNYRTYSYLDFLGKNADASWRWAVTPDFTGDVIISRTQAVNSFADYTGTFARNINTTDNRRVDMDLRVAGEWHVGAAVYQMVQNNDEPVFELENVRINSLETSLRYVSAAGNWVGLYTRVANGDYLNQGFDPTLQIENQFIEHEYGARLNYQITGKTNIYAQLGELSRDNEHFSSRNFSGLVGSVAFSYDITGKITLFANASRSLSSYQTETSSYIVDNTYSLGPTWAITDKTKLSARFQEVQYDFRNAIINDVQLRNDTLYRFTVDGTWNAFRNFTVTGSIAHQSRTSNTVGIPFVDNITSIQAVYIF